MSEANETVKNNEEKSLDQTLNLGETVRLAEGIQKTIKLGTIKLIRQVRQHSNNLQGIKFSFVIGRDPIEPNKIGDHEIQAIDCPKIEKAYKEAFNMIFVEGLTDEEYEQVDMQGIEVLDSVLDRFL